MNKFQNALYRFMSGRYGSDQLNNFLLIFALILFDEQLEKENKIAISNKIIILLKSLFIFFSFNISSCYFHNIDSIISLSVCSQFSL